MPQAPLTITTPDGYPLAARLHAASRAPRAVALVVPAMAVPQGFYAPFAGWLAQQDFDVLTFDFRGMGDSAPRSLRGFRADILTWAHQDAAAMLALARSRAAGRPVVWIGHSLGGQILAMTPGGDAIAAAITVASGVGYWRENAYPLRWYSWFLWFVAAPLATALCGYFPGRALGMVGDLPRGVIEQSLSFTDDEYMSERNVAVLHGFYANARRDLRRVAPRDAGLRRIGHFGYFRADAGGRLWPMTLDWLRQEIG